MNLYSYVANSNPTASKIICQKFGYRVANVKSKDDLAECLRSLVAQEGEPALKEILDNHPDKDIILEVFANDSTQFLGIDGTGSSKQSTCNCEKKCDCKSRENYLNADASQSRLASQTNVIIVVASLFLAVAILTKK